MKQEVALMIALLLAAMAAACGPDEDTTGELGRAEFAWDDGVLGCLFGCDAAEPMVEGGFARLRVTNASDLPEYTVAVDDGALVDASGTTVITLEGGAAGSGKVLLEGIDGELVDRFKIDVAAVERIEVSADDLYRDRLTIINGYGVQVGLDLRGEGESLKGYGGLEYELTGGISESEITLVSALADAIVGVLVGSNNEYARIDATAIGSGEVRATALSGAELVIPIQVITEADLTGVELEQTDPLIVDGEDPSFIDARFVAGAEIAQGGACQWSIDPADGPIAATFSSKSASLSATGAGSATLRCAIGDQVGVIEVSTD